MIISDLEHLEDLAGENRLVGGTTSIGQTYLLNLEHINKILVSLGLDTISTLPGIANTLNTAGSVTSSLDTGNVVSRLLSSVNGGGVSSFSSRQESKVAY